MKTLFKNAYFGKPYKTRNGRKAIYIRQYTSFEDTYHYLINDNNHYGNALSVKDNGLQCDNEENHGDIVSEWHEPIDVNKLNLLAKRYGKDEKDYLIRRIIYDAFKAGYYKAKEE